MEEHQGLAKIFARNSFYRRQYLLALGALGLALAVIVVLSLTIAYLFKTPVMPLYFATDHVGGLIRIIPPREPNMTMEELLEWAKEAAEMSYSYDYINYRTQLQNIQKYFTEYGWSNYRKALDASNNLYAVIQRKMVAIAKVTGKPKLIATGVLGNAYGWKLQMPVTVTYYSPPYDDSSRFSNELIVTLILQRRPILQSYRGLGVVQLIGAFAQPVFKEPQDISNIPRG